MPDFVAVSGNAPLTPPTGDDRRNLVNLLGHVRRIWITGVLEHSVRHAALLDPRVRMEPGAVEPPWRRYLEAAGRPAALLPPERTIGQVFDEVGRMLLILGEPGAGKTTTLLMLVRECVEQAERDPAAPVPVVLNLSLWTGSLPFHDWLVGELPRRYPVGKQFAPRWLQEHRLLLLFDGLDEVAEDRRAACVQALHAFVEEQGVAGLAVCSRTAEYRALPVRLSLGGAVHLLPLEQAQIDAYLDAAGPALGGLRDALVRNGELRELSASPLMLSIMTLAFGGLPADALRFDETSTREELREEIFGHFVGRMFTLRERSGGRFSHERVVDGLRWLASGMMQRGSIFAVELLQPAWLDRRQLLLYALVSRAAGATLVTAALGAVIFLFCLVTVLASDVRTGRALAATGSTAAAATLAASLAMGLASGLLYAAAAYHTLRRPPGWRREVRIVRELSVFFGYLALSGVAMLVILGIGGWVFGLSVHEPHLLVAFITVAVSPLALPVILGFKAGRGVADQDVGLAGTLSWQWKTAVEMMIVSAVAGLILIALAPWLGGTRLLSVVMTVIVMFTFVVYAGWRQEVPPVDQWRDRDGRYLVRESGQVFAMAALGCVLGMFPLFAFALGPAQPLRDSLALAVLTAMALLGPAIFWFGGMDLVLHAALRLVLSLTGPMPLRLRRFLDYAVHLGFLQRAGGGYIFFHRLLLEHFAARLPSNAGSAAKHPPLPAPEVRDGDGVVIIRVPDATIDRAGSVPRPGDGHAGVDARILFLAANSTRQPLDLELELRGIEDHLLRSRLRDRLALKAVPAVTVDALMRTMMEEAPTHVHFSGHGEPGGIVLRDELGHPRVVPGEALEALFGLCRDSVRCVVLNACFSEPQARAIHQHVPYVIGSTGAIQDAAALSFSSGFYLAVAAGKDVPYAFEAGKTRMGLDSVPGQEHLVLLRPDADSSPGEE
jgi:MFS family permease